MKPSPTAPIRTTRTPGLRTRLTLDQLDDRVVPAVILVNSTADSGPGSLRQAVLDSNASSGTADTINFDPTVFAAPQTINLTTGQMTITDSVTITGPGSGLLTVSGLPNTPGTANRIFTVSGTGTLDVTISGMTLTGGNLAGSPALASGAAILDGDETLTLDDVTITGNKTANYGGGISVSSVASLTIRNSTISNNAANGTGLGGGGGVHLASAARVVVQNSTISGNTARKGGALYFYNGGSLQVTGSTITGNTATSSSTSYSGGGISFFGTVTIGGFTITNSTIDGNNAAGAGGGIALASLSGTVTVQDSTITGNISSSGGGGGISKTSSTGSLVLTNTVVALNTNVTNPDVLASGTVTANNSFLGSASALTITGTGNQTGTNSNRLDPMLGPLANNGGPTPTRLPLAGSPLIDAGNTTLIPNGLTTDQRGGGFTRVSGPAVDIGSVEAQPAPVTVTSITTNRTSPTNATPITFTVAFSGPVATLPTSAFQLVRTGSANGVIGTPAPVGAGDTWTVTVSGISGNGTLALRLANGGVVSPAVSNAPVTSQPLTIDTVAPSAIINQSAGQADPTANSPISFGVFFSEPVVGFDGSDVSFAGSTATGLLTAFVTGSGANYVVQVTGMNGAGTVVASIPAGSVTDVAGNPNTASTSTDNSVTYNGPAGPTIILSPAPVTYTENDPPTILDATAAVTDPDSPDFGGGRLTVDYAANGTVDDRLAINNEGTGPGQIGVSGTTVSYGGLAIGTFNGGTGTTPLVVTFNANATPTAAAALIQNITYQNVSDDPSGAPRAVRFSIRDSGGPTPGVSNAAIKTVNVLPVNDAPTLAGPLSNATILEDAGPQTVDLMGISAGANENQTITVTATSSNPAVVPNPTVTYTSPDATGTLTFTPAADASGTATITVTVMDNGGTANGGMDTPPQPQTFTVTVVPVNDAPTLKAIPNPAPILEDAGPQTVQLTGISPGGGETQAVTITATSDNPGLIPDPAVNYTDPSSTGTLVFTPAANASGTATITVTVRDNGGTANGGVDTTVRTFTVMVTAVNDAPTIDPIPDVSLPEDSAPQTVNLAGISAGGGESQTLTVTATSNNPVLIPNPTVNYTSPGATGTLVFAPVLNQFGTATITVTVKDDGGTANGGVDTTTRTFTVTVGPVAHAPAVSNATTFEDTQTTGGLFITPNPVDGQTVAFFKISGITGGSLFLTDGVTPVAEGQFITLAQGKAGLRFTPAPNANSAAGGVFGFVAQGSLDAAGNGIGPGTPATITVVAVNDAPSFVAGPAISLSGRQAGGAQVFPGWAKGISAGPPDEAGQALAFTVVATNPTLFAVQPAVDAAGTLTFTPVPGATGSSQVFVTLRDNGGTDNGGSDTSATQSFTITLATRLVNQSEVKMFAVGPGAGNRDTVNVYNTDGSLAYTLGGPSVFAPNTGVRVAVADVTGDGVPDVVTGTGPGVTATVIVTDGATRQVVRVINPFDGAFSGGVYVALGDVDGDGAADIAVSPDQGGGGRVEVYSGRGTVRFANFFGIDDTAFRGGARVAFGDFNADGVADLAVAAGFQGGPRVALYDGKSLLTGFPTKMVNDFFVFEESVRDGVFLSAGDVNGDGFADLIAGGGPSGGPRVLVVDGQTLIKKGSSQLAPLANFFAGDDSLRTGVMVAAKDIDGDTRADVVVGLATSTGGTVESFLGSTLTPTTAPPAKWTFDALVDPFSGPFVG